MLRPGGCRRRCGRRQRLTTAVKGGSGALAGAAGRVVLMNTIFGSGLEIQHAKHYPMLMRVRANMGCAPCRFRCKRGKSVCFWGWEGGHTKDATAWGIFSRNPKKVKARAWSCARWRATSLGTCGGGFSQPHTSQFDCRGGLTPGLGSAALPFSCTVNARSVLCHRRACRAITHQRPAWCHNRVSATVVWGNPRRWH